MANITEQAKWEDSVYELALTDDVIGGPDGVDNLPHKQLANRTAYLKSCIVPTGSLIIWTTSTPPAGYLECDGAALSRATYAALFAVLGTTYNKPTDAVDKFRVPDLRGEFIRGWDHGRNADKDRALGSAQKATRVYRRNYYPDGWHNAMYDRDHRASADIDGAIEAVAAGRTKRSTSLSGFLTTGKVDGVRVRPRNVALMYAIKY